MGIDHRKISPSSIPWPGHENWLLNHCNQQPTNLSGKTQHETSTTTPATVHPWQQTLWETTKLPTAEVVEKGVRWCLHSCTLRVHASSPQRRFRNHCRRNSLEHCLPPMYGRSPQEKIARGNRSRSSNHNPPTRHTGVSTHFLRQKDRSRH